VHKFVIQLEAQLADRGVTIELSDEAAQWIADHGFDEKFGARPLSRTIQEHIKKPLADELLFGKLEKGGSVRVIVVTREGEKKLGFEYLNAPHAPAPEGTPQIEGPKAARKSSKVPALEGAKGEAPKALPPPGRKTGRGKPVEEDEDDSQE